MRSASATREELYIDEGGFVRCLAPRARGSKPCGTPVIENRLIVHHRSGNRWHGFSPAQLLRAGVDSGQFSLEEVLCEYYSLDDDRFCGLQAYRQIEGLIVIGSTEWDKAVRGPEGENPLGLADDWCPEVPLPEEWTVGLMTRLSALCQDPERDYQCIPVLWLVLPEVAGIATSLIGQYSLWGVAHDGHPTGKARSQMWSNYFLQEPQDCPFAKAAAVKEPTWKVGYVDFPRFTAEKKWEQQLAVVQERGLTVSTTPSDALMMNLLAAATGKKFRTTTWARTVDLSASAPRGVNFGPDGLRVYRVCYPGAAHPGVGAGLEGVPLELAT